MKRSMIPIETGVVSSKLKLFISVDISLWVGTGLDQAFRSTYLVSVLVIKVTR